MCTYFNFHKFIIQLISSYLTPRQQCLQVNGVISQTMHVTSGVPQGSALGPFFFIMFVNDLTKECPCYLFADDCIVEQHGEPPLSAIAKTNILLPKISKWYSDNPLKLNAAKTSVLIVANKRLDTDNLNPVILQGKIATFTKTMKYLGLPLDASLTWKDHIAKTKVKIMPMVWKFAKLHLMDYSTAHTYCTSMIRPCIEYAAAVLFNVSGQSSKTLETIQNRCLRIIAIAKPRTNTTAIRKQLNHWKTTKVFLLNFINFTKT